MKLRRSLFSRYAIYFGTLVSVALVASGVVQLFFTYQQNKDALLNLQHEKAAAAAARIESYMDNIEQQLGWMRLPQPATAGLEQRRIEYLKLLRQVPAITDVALIDNGGREQLRISRVDVDVVGSGADRSGDPKFNVPRNGKTFFSPVYFRKESEPYMTVAVAAIGADASVTAAEVNLKFIWDVVSRIKAGDKGLAYVVDSRGNLIAHPDISQVLQMTDLSALPQVRAALSAGGAAEVSIAKNSRGDEVLTVHASIAAQGWHIFVEQPVAEAFAPLYASLQRTGLLLLAGLGLALTASLLLARRMVLPIQAIQRGAMQIAAGRLEQRLDIRTGDELEALADEFNAMAARLGESYADLERKVEDRTRDLRESLEQQTATAEVLKTISRSSFELRPILEELMRSIAVLGPGDAAAIYLREENGFYSLVLVHSHDATLRKTMETGIRCIDPETNTALGRAARSRQPVQIEDVSAAEDYPWPSAGFRTALAVPILRDGAAVGVIVVVRTTEAPFARNRIDMIVTFADQAGIAIGNARLIEEIREKSRLLEQANRHKSEFLANMSHELRTPLNAIIGFSEVLKERMFGDINEKQAEYLDDIHGSGRHLLSLINDILDLSKIEAGRVELELARFDLGAALEDAIALVKDRARRSGIDVELDCEGGIDECLGDERKIKQILLNLLSNAVKFTAQGGRVSVSARCADDGIQVDVADTGVGIAADDLERVFDAFQQVGTDQLKKAEGTGLGLALTKQFVELHGGRIEVRSELGAGSVFSFYLPQGLPKTL